MPFLINSFAATSKQIDISLPFLKPDFFIAWTISFNAFSLSLIIGANPPSSPTLIEWPAFFNNTFKLFITKKHILTASLNDFALSGLIINSCILRPLSACAPPLIIFIKGKGSLKFFLTIKFLYKGIFLTFADNFFTAMDTANIVFAPNFVFCFVPSNFIRILSILSWSWMFWFFNFFEINLLTVATGIKTLFPKYFLLLLSLFS